MCAEHEPMIAFISNNVLSWLESGRCRGAMSVNRLPLPAGLTCSDLRTVLRTVLRKWGT